MSIETVDAVVIGAGHNGLVAANVLADSNWDVVVLEAGDVAGGAVRSGELTQPGFQHDLFSAFYPLGVASPVLRRLGLEDHGLEWCRSPLALAHPTPDGNCAVISPDIDETAASLDAYHPGDGDAWRRLYGLWERLDPYLVEAVLSPWPPVRPAIGVLRRLMGDGGVRAVLRFVRFALLPVRTLADEEFSGEGGPLLFGGNALHTDLTPESAAGTIYGWLLASLAQQVGFPVPRGGASAIVDALVNRLGIVGGTVRTGQRVAHIEVTHGRATGVVTAGGTTIRVRRAVLADVGAPQLYRDLVAPEHLPPQTLDDMRRFHYDSATFKVDWALSGPVPWTHPDAARAGTVHLADDLDQLTEVAGALATRRIPAHPFIIFGQQGVADPTRSPAGTSSCWAYAHVPHDARGDAGPDGLRGVWDPAETAVFAARIEAEVEARAPGFRAMVIGRHIFTPRDMEATDANLVDGALGGGTSQMHQQLILRPTPGLSTAATPVEGLFLASASAHPGGGVHGAPGNNAAHAALHGRRLRRHLAP